MKKLLLIVSTLMLSVLAACAAPTSAIAVTTNGNAMLMTNVQTAPFRIVWSGTVAIVSTAAAPITVNGARLATTNDMRAGTFTNLNIGGSNYSVSATIRAGTAIEFSFDATGVTISANGLAPDLATLSNDVLSMSGTADSALPMTGGTMTGPLASISSIAGVSYTETNSVLVAGSAIDDFNGIYTNSFVSGYFRTPQPANFSATLTWQPLDSAWVIQSNSLAYLRRINPSIVGDYDEHPDSPGASGAVVSATAYTGAVVSASGLRGNGAGITNVSASSLASGTIPAGALGTNVARTIGGLTTTGTVTAASFIGNGAGLTGIVAAAASNPYTNFFQQIATTQSVVVTIPVPTNSIDANRIEVTWRYLQTNDAPAAQLYVRLNGISGTNAYQSYLRNEGTPSTPTSPGSTNGGSGLVIGRLLSARNYTNTLSFGSMVIDNIQGTNIQTRGILSTAMAKGRDTMNLNDAFIGIYGGLATFAGAITQIQIFAVTATGTSVIDTQSMTSARFMP